MAGEVLQDRLDARVAQPGGERHRVGLHPRRVGAERAVADHVVVRGVRDVGVGGEVHGHAAGASCRPRSAASARIFGRGLRRGHLRAEGMSPSRSSTRWTRPPSSSTATATGIRAAAWTASSARFFSNAVAFRRRRSRRPGPRGPARRCRPGRRRKRRRRAAAQAGRGRRARSPATRSRRAARDSTWERKTWERKGAGAPEARVRPKGRRYGGQRQRRTRDDHALKIHDQQTSGHQAQCHPEGGKNGGSSVPSLVGVCHDRSGGPNFTA